MLFFWLSLFLFLRVSHAVNEEFVKSLTAAKDTANKAISALYNEWAIDQYPNFLKSASMHKSSWELMKFKFMEKILSAAIAGSKKDLVISFLGR